MTWSFVDVEPTTAEGSVPRAWASWVSQLSAPVRDDDPPEEAALPDESASAGEWVVHVPLPPSGKFLGEEASIRLTVKGRRSADDSSYHVKPPKPQRP